MWLLVALTAQFILGTSAVFDKLLLRRRFFDPLVYAFWIGMFGLAALVLAPFGFSVPKPAPALLALGAGAVFIGGLFFLFMALAHGKALTVLTFVGALTPLVSFLFSVFLLNTSLGSSNLTGFLFLLIGGFTLFASERDRIRLGTVVAACAAVLLFGSYSVLAKSVFAHTSFITGFVIIKFGSALTAATVLVVPVWRKRILRLSRTAVSSDRLRYAANVLYAGSGSTLFNVAIALGHPALVEATQSFKFIVIFVCSRLLLGEHLRGSELWGKIFATVLIVVGISILALGQ